jgi:hypothetical protein
MNRSFNSFYQKPGKITNDELLKKGMSIFLKDNLVEHHDFVVVSPEVWKYLQSWYSSDWSIARYLKREKLGGGKKGWVLDLYPDIKCTFSS